MPATTAGASIGMEHRVLQQCRAASSGLSLLPPSHPVPNFYLYPSPFDHEKLMACFERTKHKPWNVTADTGAWMYHALEKHPARVPTAERAEVLYYPTFAHLSESAGTCDGKSHYSRMVAAANALKAEHTFVMRPTDHLLVNGVESATRAPLGELGALVSGRGGFAACLDAKLCGFFKPERVLPLPWPSLHLLQTAAVRSLVDSEACGVRRSANSPYGARSTTLFFRGGLGTSKAAQDLRIRIPLLKSLSGAQIAIIGNDHVLPSSQSILSKNGQAKVNKLKRMDEQTYARSMLKSKFCLCPAGDVGVSPGQRLYDAIAAGCVPILLGVDAKQLPLAKQIDYKKFTASLSKQGFTKDPVYAIESIIHRLEPNHPNMLRALADARGRLLYGTSDDGYPIVQSSRNFSEAAGMLLREFRMMDRNAPVEAAKPLKDLI